ncbi:glycoside hydrolase family 1 protein [Actinomadura barringtoniae]|uniref:beta-glucosidase n=1 Tax=Actinomadura barringtoniae TaxID=1427535 RepID=A0A939P9M0_9ACTN|nr:family 1 glycosylhydrolase [Actinomadura barringtoniae]MBO2448692.1 glycoside hydrolase family 1 protein [Actinomadura barringtoniae]
MTPLDGFDVPGGFLWGASTSAHQTEGNNTTSDWWALEQEPESFVKEPSRDAADSFHRWEEDMDLLAAAGFTDYRFSIEWARIEPVDGQFSLAALAHYRAMIDGALARGLRPLITLHHFTTPAWFARQGGWGAPGAVDRYLRYAEAVAPILRDGVERVCTINEPNVVSVFDRLLNEGVSVFEGGIPEPDEVIANALIEAHGRAGVLLREQVPGLQIGWCVAVIDVQAAPDAHAQAEQWVRSRLDPFLNAARDDDWIGVQTYTRIRIGNREGEPVRLRAEGGAARTLTGWEYYPSALGGAVRFTAARTGLPVIVTENGIATDDDAQRIAYTSDALRSLQEAMADGVDVRGYFHWSLLDNYEWGDYAPTYGLVAVDPTTFARTPKPSLAWLGGLARSA